MQAGYETRDKYIRYSTRGHNNAANRSAPSSRASCCRGLSAPAMARPLRLRLNCPPARGGPAPVKLKAARLGRLLLAIAAGRMQPRIAHRPFSAALRRHGRRRRRAGARCHPWVPTGCTARERHRGEALHCQLLGRNQGSRWQTSCYQRCGARDWGRGKGQQHAYPVGEVPKLTVSRRMSKKIRHEREDQLVDGHSSDTAIMPLFAQGPWQAVRREPTTIEWPVSRLSPRGVG